MVVRVVTPPTFSVDVVIPSFFLVDEDATLILRVTIVVFFVIGWPLFTSDFTTSSLLEADEVLEGLEPLLWSLGGELTQWTAMELPFSTKANKSKISN